MSKDDRSEKGQQPPSNSLAGRPEDDFVLRSHIDRGKSDRKRAERRLHLRAFDYWHALHGGKPMPFFGDLTAEGLLPFKRNCLLLEFMGVDIVVRFCGTELAPLLGGILPAGSRLVEAKIDTFSGALMSRLQSVEGRQEAAEFEFVDDPVECRGILLPFSARGQTAEFVMVVVNHRQRSIGAQERQKITVEDPVGSTTSQHEHLQDLAGECRQAGQTVVHPGVGTRESLYMALAEAYRFHIEASRDPAAYRKFLRNQGMRQQRRAPFTPALKLTFGPDYEKTRLTEYAAALSYAARHEVGPDNLPDFLSHEPGGIKGCVARERAFRRGDSEGQANPAREIAREIAREAARSLKSQPLQDLKLDEEYSLVLVRRDAKGGNQILTPVRSSDHMIERAISQALKQQE